MTPPSEHYPLQTPLNIEHYELYLKRGLKHRRPVHAHRHQTLQQVGRARLLLLYDR